MINFSWYCFFLQELDGADRLLTAERSHLLSLKRSLESQLRKVQQQLQVLNVARARLSAAIQERSRVTDLLCHSMSSTIHTSDLGRPNTVPRASIKGHTKSYSAPAPLHITSSRDVGLGGDSEACAHAGRSASWGTCLHITCVCVPSSIVASFPGSPCAWTKNQKKRATFPYYKRQKVGRGLGTS